MRRAETKRPLAVHDGSDQVYDPTTAKRLPPVLQTNNRDLHIPQNSSYCTSLTSLPTLHTRKPPHPKASPPSHPLPSFSTPATKPLPPHPHPHPHPHPQLPPHLDPPPKRRQQISFARNRQPLKPHLQPTPLRPRGMQQHCIRPTAASGAARFGFPSRTNPWPGPTRVPERGVAVAMRCGCGKI